MKLKNLQTLSKKRAQAVYTNSSGIFFKSNCLDLLAGIKSNSVDMCFTDPPFNIGKKYFIPSFNDRMEKGRYDEWCKKWLNELIRVLKPGGTLCIYLLPRIAIDVGYWLNQNPEIEYRSLIGLKMKSYSIKGRLNPALYTILYYTKKGRKHTFNVVRNRTPVCRYCKKEIRDYGGYRKKFVEFEDEKGVPWIQIADFWEDTRPARQDKTRETLVNELPLHIPERIILMASNPNDVVLDIFGGSGSTYHAAQLHGRLWIGCDISNPVSILSRFATIWGRKETQKVHPRIKKCFNEEFLRFYMSMKKRGRIYPIRQVSLLSNGNALKKIDVVSKSRTEVNGRSII